MKKLLHIALFALGIFYLNLSYAARPMLTDDARIVDPKACQLESWIRDSKHITEYWALPSCNVSENLK